MKKTMLSNFGRSLAYRHLVVTANSSYIFYPIYYAQPTNADNLTTKSIFLLSSFNQRVQRSRSRAFHP
jgi:hypothetical protein